MTQEGYIVGLAYVELIGYDDEGREIARSKASVKGNHNYWRTPGKVRKELIDVYRAVKIKRRNVWAFKAVEGGDNEEAV